LESWIFLLFLLIGWLVVVPVFAIVAFVISRKTNQKLKDLERRIQKMDGFKESPAEQPGVAAAVLRHEASCAQAAADERPAEKQPEKTAVAEQKSAIPRKTETRELSSIETRLGIKVAAWVGVVLLLISAGFFVVYAVQRQWMSPGMRVTLGILFGAGLTAFAYKLEGRGYKVLSRVLTAGGSAAMYFSIFAARGFYGIIGPVPAFLGLAFVSACSMALSALYNSQSIALGSLLGAFFVPPLTGSETESGVFFLGFVQLSPYSFHVTSSMPHARFRPSFM
jgi:uncharacterized membrane protein